ncbi:hypothetical protein QN239_27400 [Mycolicibacterium sp. Y3]
MPIIDPVKECRAAVQKFQHVQSHANDADIRELAAGLQHLATAVRAIADPEGAKLAMDWPWSVTENVKKPAGS